jgi:hypothetical protein
MMENTSAQPDLATFILAEVQRQTSEEALRKIVETKIGECVKSAVDSAMRSYGNVGKQIEKAVENSLSIGDRVDVPAYGVMVMNVLRAKMDEVLGEHINKHLANEMADILKIAPKELKLSDVVEAMIKEIDVGERYGTHITLIAEASENVDGYWHVYLDEEENTRKYDCEVQIAIDGNGKIYSLKCGGRDAKGTIIMGPLHGYQKMIFSAYACGSKFIVDEPDYISTGIGDF